MGDFNPNNYDDSFMADLVAFVAGEEFQTMFEAFFLKYSIEFEYGEEQKLRYYEIYQDFHDLFEGKLEEFCKSKGVTQSEFLKRCREATGDDDKSKHYMNILLSSVEYETFVKLMYIMKPVAEKRAQQEAEAKALEDRYAGLHIEEKGAEESKAGAKGVDNEENPDAKELEIMGGSDAKGGSDGDDAKGGSK